MLNILHHPVTEKLASGIGYFVLGLICAVPVLFAVLWLYDKIHAKVDKDFIHYHILRGSFTTEYLREFYPFLNHSPRLKKWALRYRLRNIKRASK